MTKSQENILNKKTHEQFQKVRDAGLLAGCKAMCGAIFEMTKKNDQSEMEKLVSISRLCIKTLGLPDIV